MPDSFSATPFLVRINLPDDHNPQCLWRTLMMYGPGETTNRGGNHGNVFDQPMLAHSRFLGNVGIGRENCLT